MSNHGHYFFGTAHLWKQTSTFGLPRLEVECETATFNEWENFFKFFSLESPCIWTLSQSTEAPGLVPGDLTTCKLGDNCNLPDSPTTTKSRTKMPITSQRGKPFNLSTKTSYCILSYQNTWNNSNYMITMEQFFPSILLGFPVIQTKTKRRKQILFPNFTK